MLRNIPDMPRLRGKQDTLRAVVNDSVIDGNASARCGISLRGLDMVVKGSVGHMAAFMAQAGNIIVLGDAGDALGSAAKQGESELLV